MPKYLLQGSYTEQGLKGLLKEGGSKRREAVKKAIESLDGRLEAVYFAFGDNDFYIIVEYPNNVNATVGALVAGATGTLNLKTTVLITPEEVDQAAKQAEKLAGAYRAPGQ